MHKTLRIMSGLAVLGVCLAMATPSFAKEPKHPGAPVPPTAVPAPGIQLPPSPPPVVGPHSATKARKAPVNMMAKKQQECMKMPEKMTPACAKSKKCKAKFEKKKAECDQMKADQDKMRAMHEKMMQENRMRYEEMRKAKESEKIFEKMTRRQTGKSPVIDPAPGNTQEVPLPTGPIFPMGPMAFPPVR